jgi:hypothetical protein
MEGFTIEIPYQENIGKFLDWISENKDIVKNSIDYDEEVMYRVITNIAEFEYSIRSGEGEEDYPYSELVGIKVGDTKINLKGLTRVYQLGEEEKEVS